MKIALYIEALQIGGAETLLVKNAMAFKRHGEDVVVIVNRLVGSFLEEELANNNIPVIPLVGPKVFSRGYRLLRKVAGVNPDKTRAWRIIIEELKPDVVHLHSAPNVLLERLPLSPNRFAFSFHSAGDRVLRMINERQRQSLDYLAQNGGMIVSISSSVESDVIRSLHPVESKLIPNCFDIAEVSMAKRDRAAFLEAIDVPSNSFILLHIGRFHPVKNHEKLFDILEEMLKREPLAYLVLVGDGPAERKAELEHRAEDMGLRDHVIFYGLSDSPAEIISVSDALALPSLVEGFSLVALEAQALNRRCVVASSIPPEVKCRPNMLVLDVEEPSSVWADFVLGDFEQPDGCMDINEFDEKTVVPKILKMYDEMCKHDGYARSFSDVVS